MRAHISLKQLADDLVNIAARAESLAGAGDDHDLRLIVAPELNHQVTQLRVDFKRQRVERVRTVERDCRHAVFNFIFKIVSHKRRSERYQNITAPPSILMPSPLTPCATSSPIITPIPATPPRPTT